MPVSSVIVTRMPGPVDRHQAGQHAEAVGLLLGLRERRLARRGVVEQQVVAACVSRSISAWVRCGGARQPVEDVDQVLLAQPGVGVVLVGWRGPG